MTFGALHHTEDMAFQNNHRRSQRPTNLHCPTRSLRYAMPFRGFHQDAGSLGGLVGTADTGYHEHYHPASPNNTLDSGVYSGVSENESRSSIGSTISGNITDALNTSGGLQSHNSSLNHGSSHQDYSRTKDTPSGSDSVCRTNDRINDSLNACNYYKTHKLLPRGREKQMVIGNACNVKTSEPSANTALGCNCLEHRHSARDSSMLLKLSQMTVHQGSTPSPTQTPLGKTARNFENKSLEYTRNSTL